MFKSLLSFLFVIAASAMFAADAPAAAKPVVVIDTSLGAIEVELDQEKAPISVKNFLAYVDDKFYDGTVFHRVIGTFMIQGGGFDADLKEKETKDPIKNESSNGLKNETGTIAMARLPDPDSATAQFFINVANNVPLDGQYAVFGKVVKGMDVVDKIKAVSTGLKTAEIQGKPTPMSDVPTETVLIKSITRKG